MLLAGQFIVLRSLEYLLLQSQDDTLHCLKWKSRISAQRNTCPNLQRRPVLLITTNISLVLRKELVRHPVNVHTSRRRQSIYVMCLWIAAEYKHTTVRSIAESFRTKQATIPKFLCFYTHIIAGCSLAYLTSNGVQTTKEGRPATSFTEVKRTGISRNLLLPWVVGRARLHLYQNRTTVFPVWQDCRERKYLVLSG